MPAASHFSENRALTGSDGKAEHQIRSRSSPVESADIPPYAEEVAETIKRLDTNVQTGLSREQFTARLKRSGLNEIQQSARRPAWKLLLSQFSSIVVWLLIAASVVALFTDSSLEAAAILVVLVLNAFIGFAIEWQAGRAVEALRRTARTTTRVRREGRESVTDSSELVAGDIIVLSAGDRVPADARVIEAANLRTDESTLTGESAPVDKSTGAVARNTPLAERSSMIFLGSSVTAGRALAVVAHTGPRTELGRIGRMLEDTGQTKTPLERRLAELGRRLVYVVLGVAVVVMITGLLEGDEIWLMAKISISLAVAAVPEGLPAVTTLILALGVLRMARRSAIVRHLSAVETLGSTTVICTDKTGTLTQNRMTVEELHLADEREIRVAGNEDPDERQLSHDDQLFRLLRVAALCNEAAFHPLEKTAVGDPTETALLDAAHRLGFDIGGMRSVSIRLHEIPFEAISKRMTSVFDTGESTELALLKGAPAVVLGACTHYLDRNGRLASMSDDVRGGFQKLNEEMAARALRVLAFGERQLDREDCSDLEGGYTFLGFAGMSDPPRAGVAEAIRTARAAGIRVVMLTGDQMLTAQAIAHRLKLTEDHDVVALHSRDLSASTGPKLAELARNAHVFARVTPEDKLRIVEALQQTGEIVAVTGDGVNDAPALKRADIGVAMGKRGTDVAKEAADVILTDDNFSTIVHAIEGGRTIYGNIIKFVHMLFSANLGEVLMIFGSMIGGLPLPLMPLQILWMNLVTDIFPALALAVEPASDDTMRRPPRSSKESLLSGRFMLLIGWQGAMLGAIALLVYMWALSIYGEGSHSRTVALLAVVGVQLGHMFNCRSRSRSALHRFLSNPFIFVATAIVIGLQLLAVGFQPLMTVLDTARPTREDWFVAAICVILPIVIVEVTKYLSWIPRRAGSSEIRPPTEA